MQAMEEAGALVATIEVIQLKLIIILGVICMCGFNALSQVQMNYDLLHYMAAKEPDPDPEKCICKGTGKIVQGDGHVSPCPYHAKTDSQPTIQTYIVPRFRLFDFLRPRG